MLRTFIVLAVVLALAVWIPKLLPDSKRALYWSFLAGVATTVLTSPLWMPLLLAWAFSK